MKLLTNRFSFSHLLFLLAFAYSFEAFAAEHVMTKPATEDKAEIMAARKVLNRYDSIKGGLIGAKKQ